MILGNMRLKEDRVLDKTKPSVSKGKSLGLDDEDVQTAKNLLLAFIFTTYN